MPKFMVDFDTNDLSDELERNVKGMKKIVERSRNWLHNPKDVEAALMLVPEFLDELVELFVTYRGELGENLASEYFYGKACLLGMCGKTAEGKRYIEKGRKYRTGGVLYEWLQTYYHM